MVDPLLCMLFSVIFALSFLFSFFFPLVTDKDEKTYFHTETNDFDQPTSCGAPFCWSKYTKKYFWKKKLFSDHNLCKIRITSSYLHLIQITSCTNWLFINYVIQRGRGGLGQGIMFGVFLRVNWKSEKIYFTLRVFYFSIP